MFFEINVEQGQKFLFATTPDSVESMEELKNMLALFTEKFPASEGYNFTVYRKEVVRTDTTVDISGLMSIIRLEKEHAPA